jgi:hypothetical protein
MLFLFLGMIEIGNVLAVSHTLSRISREGANIASRGTSLEAVVGVLATNGSDIHLAGRGGSVVSRVFMEEDGPRILAQATSPGLVDRSRIGTVGTEVTSFASYGMDTGNTVYVVELFYHYRPITPFARLFESALPDPIYERTVF